MIEVKLWDSTSRRPNLSQMKMRTSATRRIITVKVKVEEDENEELPKVKAELEFPLPNAVKQSECMKDEAGTVQVKEEPSTWTSSPPAKKRKGGPPRKYFTEAERRKAKTEKERFRKATMTPDQREQRLQKRREQAKRRRERLTEEQRNKLKRKRCEYERMHSKKMAKEKKEQILKRKRESGRKRKATMTPEQREERRRRTRQHQRKYAQAKKANMTEDEKKERREKQREKRQKYKETEKTEEEKKKVRYQQYFRVQAKLAQMTPEERKEWTRKNTEYARKWRQSLTGEKRQRYLEYLKRKTRKYLQTDNFKSSEVYSKFLEYQRNKVAMETPEERQKRLRRYKVNQAVRKLRKELEDGGVSKEDIETKAMELKTRMWAEPLPPPEKISTYTPRKSNRVARGENNRELFKSASGRRRWSTPSASKNISSTVELHDSKVIEGVSAEKQIMLCDVGESEEFDEHHIDDGVNYETEEDPITSISPLMPPQLESKMTTTHNESTSQPRLTSSESTKCPHCSSHFPQKFDLIAHVSSEHPKKLWKCPICKAIALNPTELKEHFKSEHAPQLSQKRPTQEDQRQSENKMSFNCIKCDPTSPNSEKAFGSKKELNEHVKSKHRESYWPCSKCDLLKYSKNSLETHERICNGNSDKKQRFKCFRR